ncbi:MAG TPA: hypothetical protein VFI42_00440 [Thermomicrobiaceae bacterium]|nr:hypothetical protein [Thermomicrobiaceae bacterium]
MSEQEPEMAQAERALGRQPVRDAAPIDQVRETYDGEWVVVRIEAYDENHQPSCGTVLFHGHDHDAAWDALGQLMAHTPESTAAYAVFQAVPLVRTGEEMRKALEKAESSGAERAWTRW